jgi:hypothetical protein
MNRVVYCTTTAVQRPCPLQVSCTVPAPVVLMDLCSCTSPIKPGASTRQSTGLPWLPEPSEQDTVATPFTMAVAGCWPF